MGASGSNLGFNLRQIAKSPVTLVCAAVMLIVQVCVVADWSGVPRHSAVEWFALRRSGFLTGQVWEIVTYALLHGAWWHVAFNAAFVVLIGSRIEHIAGRKAMLTVFFAGIVAGGALHLLLGPDGALVGASGGCVALLLLLTTLSPESRMMPLPVRGKNLGRAILLVEGVFTLLDPGSPLPGLSHFGRVLAGHGMGEWFHLGHACHFGGALAGFACGRWILRPRVSLERLRRERARREALEAKRRC